MVHNLLFFQTKKDNNSMKKIKIKIGTGQCNLNLKGPKYLQLDEKWTFQ